MPIPVSHSFHQSSLPVLILIYMLILFYWAALGMQTQPRFTKMSVSTSIGPTGTRYLRSINSISRINYADPDLYEGFLSLPFIRFPPTNAFPEPIRGVEEFWYMSREIFTQLDKAVHREDIQMGNNHLYLCDASGTGKSPRGLGLSTRL